MNTSPPPTSNANGGAAVASSTSSPAGEPADYPDRSTYQTLPDTPDGGSLIAVVGDDEDDDDAYDLEALRATYKRTTSYPAPGFVRRDITRASSSRSPAPAKPLSPVLSLVGGEMRFGMYRLNLVLAWSLWCLGGGYVCESICMAWRHGDGDDSRGDRRRRRQTDRDRDQTETERQID